MAGTITVLSDGQTVRVEDRIYSLDSNGEIIHADAFKKLGVSSDPVELWRCQPSLRTVTGFLARNIAQVALHGFEYGDHGDRDRIDRSTPLARLLRKPDRTQTAYEFMHALVIDVCLFDRYAAQMFLEDDGSWRVVRIPPSVWKFDRGPTGRPNSIKARRKDGTEYTISLDRAFWIDGFPSDEDTSPIAALQEVLEEQQQSASYRRDLWRNGGRFPGWITRPHDAPPWSAPGPSGVSPREVFRAGWAKYSSGGDRAGATPILEDGMTYEEAKRGLTPEAAQQIEGRKFSIAETAAAYYVHPQLLGLLDGNYSNVSAYREILYSDTLGTWFQQIEQAFNCRAVPLIDDPDVVFVEFNVHEKLRVSFESQAKILQTATGAPIMLRSEARQRLNLPFVKGTDELVVPLNVTEGGQASPTDSGSQNEGMNE